MKFRAIANKIIELKDKDLALRNQLIQSKQLGNGYNEQMAQLHKSNAETLEKIINQIGYPTIDKVGKDGSEAAWLIIQHSIGQPAFMKKCAALLQIAVDEKKANPVSLAYLNDRIAVFEGKPQSYGTQFDWDNNGQMSPQPYDDLGKVNQRRKAIGLNTLEEQIKIMRKQAKDENEIPPNDYEARQKKIIAWKKLVGWQK